MGVRLKILVGLLALGFVAVSLPRIASHAEQAESAAAVVQLTDVPGKWFDPAVTVVPVGVYFGLARDEAAADTNTALAPAPAAPAATK